MRRAHLYIIPLLLVAGLIGWILVKGCFHSFVVVPDAQQKWGFRSTKVYVASDDLTPDERLRVESIKPGGAFDDAGFRNGDIVLSHTYSEFIQALTAEGPIDLTVTVGNGGPSTKVADMATRTIKLTEPPQ